MEQRIDIERLDVNQLGVDGCYARPVPPPVDVPIGVHLTRVARSASRAFDAALVEAGGSQPTWSVLIALKTRPTASQRQLAAAVGIRGATLTHHLDAMESAGLVTRRRDPANRRVHIVEMTEAGEATFHRLRTAAQAFDRRLRSGLSGEDVAQLAALLTRVQQNVGGTDGSGGMAEVAVTDRFRPVGSSDPPGEPRA